MSDPRPSTICCECQLDQQPFTGTVCGGCRAFICAACAKDSRRRGLGDFCLSVVCSQCPSEFDEMFDVFDTVAFRKASGRLTPTSVSQTAPPMMPARREKRGRIEISINKFPGRVFEGPASTDSLFAISDERGRIRPHILDGKEMCTIYGCRECRIVPPTSPKKVRLRDDQHRLASRLE